MTSQKKTGRGLDSTMLLGSLAVLAAGLAAAAVGLFTSFGLRIGPIPIPLSIVGPIVALIGLGLIVMSFRDTKCLACKESLESSLAAFPLESEAQVVDAVNRLDAKALEALGMGDMSEKNVQVSLEHCPKCAAVGLVEVTAFRGDKGVALVPSQEIEGERVRDFAKVMTERAKAHEDRYSEQNDESDDE